MTTPQDPATVDNSLRLGAGIHAEERATILHQWAALDARLRSFNDDQVQLILTVKERDSLGQKMTLEALIAGWPRMAATSHRPKFTAALIEVRDDLIRQISDAMQRHEPRNNRHLRATPRHE